VPMVFFFDESQSLGVPWEGKEHRSDPRAAKHESEDLRCGFSPSLRVMEKCVCRRKTAAAPVTGAAVFEF